MNQMIKQPIKLPTRQVTIEFIDVEERQAGSKQLWNFQDASGERWAVWEEGLAQAISDAMSNQPSIKVEYYEKTNIANGKTYRNKTIVNAFVGDGWVKPKKDAKDAPESSSNRNGQVKTDLPEHTALIAASRIVAAFIAKSESAGTLALHAASTINMAAQLKSFFGAKPMAEPQKDEPPNGDTEMEEASF